MVRVLLEMIQEGTLILRAGTAAPIRDIMAHLVVVVVIHHHHHPEGDPLLILVPGANSISNKSTRRCPDRAVTRP